jgi:hypothetical protein
MTNLANRPSSVPATNPGTAPGPATGPAMLNHKEMKIQSILPMR